MLKNLTVQILIAAVVAAIGARLFGDSSWLTSPTPFYDTILMIKVAFLAALKMLIAPMIFFSLISGISNIGNVVRLRRLGGVTVLYYMGTTGLAIVLGLIAVFWIHPWEAYPPALESSLVFSESRMIDPGSDSLIAILKQILVMAFANPFHALVNLNIIGIVTSAILLGLAMVITLKPESPVFSIVRDLNQIIMTVLSWIIRLLPIGIFAIIFDFSLRLSISDEFSQDFLTQLLQFSVLVTGLTLFHGFVILPLVAWMTTGQHPVRLVRSIAQPLLVAFSTSSSAATLPVSMKTAQEKLGVSQSVSSFVLPLGATMNMDGTALFEAVAAIFLAYLYGIELSTLMVITVFLMAMISSIGAPGMPTASMSGMQIVLLAVGIPLEAIAILLIIERPLDTFRTTVNVQGDLIGTLVVQHYLNRRDQQASRSA
ncbi:MAG TPA: Na+:H+ dicarboxylate symporter [Gammaproteobacteria bacterium]|jgi:Na+/H+-dicarboxylate symporter|nr:dicarboxylate/amino acid:cation symporter [Gammaproteobacteria bacterium]MDA0825921.1 dicarboxylate/amino acid:cation symporter [Pseudomonadota bacterium]MDB3978032.1 dicarboxylate/amino acid:cation symporter [Pseudomonadales bacterium]MDB3986279.1 dicarboxylate/amino acid:cation symporter [Pseudomonadales bacterium]MDB4035240.1 dicarboxylate/amino acid:cation symporter [Pseudomonadales bacterium]